MVSLRHIHLPSYPSYTTAVLIQDHLRRLLLTSKDHPSTHPPPPPTLLSFTPTPTYTLGRRQTSPLSPTTLQTLSSPLGPYHPAVLPSPRGGLTTYHGPGQLVLWPVLDLVSPLHNHFSVRSYARLLEQTTIALLAAHSHIEAHTTPDPGVWVTSRLDGVERKIAAMGVHLRRHVASLGVALNMDFRPGAPDDDPWKRFVPCGLEGREVTSMAREMEANCGSETGSIRVDRGDVLASRWAEEFAERIGARAVEEVDVAGVYKAVGLEPPEVVQEEERS
jgi:lipoyl(octanoyl) transferase